MDKLVTKEARLRRLEEARNVYVVFYGKAGIYYLYTNRVTGRYLIEQDISCEDILVLYDFHKKNLVFDTERGCLQTFVPLREVESWVRKADTRRYENSPRHAVEEKSFKKRRNPSAKDNV